MKKLIFALSLLCAFVCLFSLCAFAEEITVNEIKSETYGTVYQLSSDPGLDEADKYISTLTNIVDAGTDTESLSILTDGTYFYVFPSSYITYEISNGKFEVYAGTDSKPGVNQAFSEWNSDEGTSLPQFELTGSYKSTNFVSLVRIEISSDVTFFDGNHCFLDFSNLKEVRFYEGQRVASGLFNSAPALETVIGLENTTGFDGSTHFFRGCTNLKTVTLPSGLTSIGKETFWGCSSLVEIGNWEEATKNVTSIGQEAFYGCSGLKSIAFSDSLTSVGQSAFYNCSSLESVQLFDSVTSIGNYAFYNCASLTEFDVPNSLITVGTASFKDCSAITRLEFPRTTTSVGQEAFCGCSGLISIVFPDSLTTIGQSAFYNCSSLESIDLPDTVTTINQYAFFGCKSLTEFDVPNSLVTMGGKCFQGCSGITRLEFPPTTTSFGQDCFNGCSSLTYLNVPRDCTYIGNYALAGCSNLEVLDMSEAKSLTSLGSHNQFGKVTSLVFPEGFLTCDSIYGDSLTEIVFPSSTTYIGLIKCARLEEFTFPENTTKLINKQFDYCANLKKVTLPRSLSSISTTGETSFFGTSRSNLKEIVFTGTPDNKAILDVQALLPNATIIFANHCDIYYGSEHTNTNEKILFVNADGTEGEKFLSYANVCVDCTRCYETTVIKSVDPLFTNKGWSVDEESKNAITQSFTLNKDSLPFYEENFKITDFGIVGAINSYFKNGEEIINSNGELLTICDNKLSSNDGAISASFAQTEYEIFKLKVTGLDGDNAKAKIFISAYVVSDGEIFHLSNGKASVGVASNSTSVEALLSSKE